MIATSLYYNRRIAHATMLDLLRSLPILLRCVAISLVCVACSEQPTAPPPPEDGFLAVLLNYSSWAGVSPGNDYEIRVREASGTLEIDRIARAGPGDTVIMELPVATYRVDLAGVPESCTNRYGLALGARISLPGNTSVVRYNLECRPLLAIRTYTDGQQLDDAFVYRVVEPSGTERTGVILPVDTISIDGIGAGSYQVELSHVAPNCTITSDAGRQQRVLVDPPRSSAAAFRVRCSDPAERPHILRFQSSYHDGTSAFFVEAYDPNLDLDTYAWNITDCRGRSVVPRGPVERYGLSSGRTTRGDTVRFAITVQVGEPDYRMTDRCTTLRVGDLRGNSSDVAEDRIGSAEGTPPTAREFNAFFFGVSSLRIRVVPEDPDDDFASAFVSVLLRDGVLSKADGQPDIGVFNIYGYSDPASIPDLPIGSSVKLDDVLGVTVDLIDEAGNLTRLYDRDLLR